MGVAVSIIGCTRMGHEHRVYCAEVLIVLSREGGVMPFDCAT